MTWNLPVLIQWNRFEAIRTISCGWSIFSSAFLGALYLVIHSELASSLPKFGDASSDCSVLLA